ncbi:hypothetical protein FHG87_013637 [Trinorchestia longiramus]|nr:hypothetical protein FHG87_013637 [Trinorchestia longiramus]
MSDKEAPDILAAACSAVGIDELDDLMNSTDQAENSIPASTLSMQCGTNDVKQAFYPAESRPYAVLEGRVATTASNHLRPYVISGPYVRPPNQGWDLRTHSQFGNRRDAGMSMDHPRPGYSYVASEVKDGYVGNRVEGYAPHPYPTYINEHQRVIHGVPHKVHSPSTSHETVYPHRAKVVDSQYPPHTVSHIPASPQRVVYPNITQPVRQAYPPYTLQSQHPPYLQSMYSNPYYPTVHTFPHPRMPRSQQTQTIPHPYPIPERMKGKMVFHSPHENFDSRRSHGAPEHVQPQTEHLNDKMLQRQMVRPPIPSHKKEIVQPLLPMYPVDTKNHPRNSSHHENGVIRQYIRVPVPNNFQAPNTITRLPNLTYPFFPHYVPENHSEAPANIRKKAPHGPGGFAHAPQPQMTSIRHPVRIAAPIIEVPDMMKANKPAGHYGHSNSGHDTEDSKHLLAQQFRYPSSSSRLYPTATETTATHTVPVTSYITLPQQGQNQEHRINHSNAQDSRNNSEYFLHGDYAKQGISSKVIVSAISREEHYLPNDAQEKRLSDISSTRTEKEPQLDIPYGRLTQATEKDSTPDQNAWSSNDPKSMNYLGYDQNAATYNRGHPYLNLCKKQDPENPPSSNSEVMEPYGRTNTVRYPQYYNTGCQNLEPNAFLYAPDQLRPSKDSIYNHPGKRSPDKVSISSSPVLVNNLRIHDNSPNHIEKPFSKSPVNRATVLREVEYGSNYNHQLNHHPPSLQPHINSTSPRESIINPHQPTNPKLSMHDGTASQRPLIHQSNHQSSRGTYFTVSQYSSPTTSSIINNNNMTHYQNTSTTPNVSWSHQDFSTSTSQIPISVAADKAPLTSSNTAERPTNVDILRIKDENLRRECKLSPKAIFFERMRSSAAAQPEQERSTEAKSPPASCPVQFSPSHQVKTVPMKYNKKKRRLSETDDLPMLSETGRPYIYPNRSPCASLQQPCSNSELLAMVDNQTATSTRVSPDSNTDTTFSPGISLPDLERRGWQKQVPQMQHCTEGPISPDTSDAYHNRTNPSPINSTLDMRRKPPPPYSVACNRLQPEVLNNFDQAKYSQLEVKNCPKSVRRLSIDDNVTIEKHPFEKASCSIGTSENTSSSSFKAISYEWPSCSFVPNTAPSISKKGRYDIKDDELFASTARAVTPPQCTPYSKSYTVGTGIHELQNIKKIPVDEERSPDDLINTNDESETSGQEDPHNKPEIKRSVSAKSPPMESPNSPHEDSPAKEETETERFIKLLRPVLTTLLSVPEAESFRPLLDQPGKLLEEMVKRGGGEPSTETDHLQRMKKNFKLFIRQYINPETRSEWGWEDSSIDDILELLSAQAGSARDALSATDQTSAPVEGSLMCSSSPRSCNQEKDRSETDIRDQTMTKTVSPSLASPDSRNCEQELKQSERGAPTESSSAVDRTKVTTSQENREICKSTSPDLLPQEALTKQSKEMFNFKPTACGFEGNINRTSNKNVDDCSIKPDNFIAGRTSNIVRSYATSTTDPLSPLSSGSTSASNSSLDPTAFHGASPRTRFPTVDMSPTEATKKELADDDVVEETTHLDINSSVNQVSSATESYSSC